MTAKFFRQRQLRRQLRREGRKRLLKRALAPSIIFDESVIDDFTVDGVKLLESVYREQVKVTGRRIRYSSPSGPSVDF